MAIRTGGGYNLTPAQRQQMRARGTVVDQYDPTLAGPQYARNPGTGTNATRLIPASVGGFTPYAPKNLGASGVTFGRANTNTVQDRRATSAPMQTMVPRGTPVQGQPVPSGQPTVHLQSGQSLTPGQEWINSMIGQYNQGTLRPDQIQDLQANQANNPNLSPEQRAAIQGMVAGGSSGGAPQTGLRGAEAALREGLSGALSSVRGATDRARGDVENYLGQATDTLDDYYRAGVGASDRQAALSGALGPEAQQQAFADYLASPEQDYLREMGEQAILRNASATGGLGGGRVLQELQRHGIGLAAQDYANSFDRLGTLANRGLTSGSDIARALLTSGGALADMEMGAGLTSGDYRYRTGDSTAAGRTRAGEQIAASTQDTVSNLADVLFRSGLAGGEQYNQLTSNLANLLAGQGTAQLTADQQLAALLANIATGQGSQLAGLRGVPGVQQTGSQLGNLGLLAGGIGGLLEAIG